jgi:23S rRNA pseudouridine2457 synthase
MKKLKYYCINKPYGVLSQFTDKQGRKTLADYCNLPVDVYPVGRLDYDSEGLLILTNDKLLTDYLLNPKYFHEREYLVQVDGIPNENDLDKLRDGIVIEKKKTLPAKVCLLDEVNIHPRNPPIRERKSIPTSWLSITIIEGRNRQVRKMTAKIGCPTLRLIRIRIKNILLGDLPPGRIRELNEIEINGLWK